MDHSALGQQTVALAINSALCGGQAAWGATMKTIAILQSNYIPWKGYFDLIAAVDEFILFDDMQYTRRDWRNRNQIKTRSGVQWLTIPVKTKGQFHQRIRDTEIDDSSWAQTHWKALVHSYGASAHFKSIAEWLEPLYLTGTDEMLSSVNRRFLEAICHYLGITTKISNSWDYRMAEGKTERLVSLCQETGAARYISGPAARDYIVPELFDTAGIELTYFDYAGFNPYPQLWGDFVHGVTILDVLFNCGPNSRNFLRN